MKQNRLLICGFAELNRYKNSGVTHMVRISNPGFKLENPPWFSGETLHLSFGDVFSRRDAEQLNTRSPKLHDIQGAVYFTNTAWQNEFSNVLFHCDQGASRSPAMAFVCLAAWLGDGKEQQALEEIMAIRPEAMPNSYVVTLGDQFLNRHGKITDALGQHVDV